MVLTLRKQKEQQLTEINKKVTTIFVWEAIHNLRPGSRISYFMIKHYHHGTWFNLITS